MSSRRMHALVCRFLNLCAAGAIASAFFLMPAGSLTSFADEKPAKPAKSIVIRLINITIPPDSRLRNLSTIAKPPLLYLQLYENGALIGTSSTVVSGWETDFPAIDQNQWTIKADSKTRYAIKVMDDNWLGDDLVFEITGRKAIDLQTVLREKGSVADATDRLATVEFEVISGEALSPSKDAPTTKEK